MTDVTKNYVDHNGLVIYQNQGKLIWHFVDREGRVDDTVFASTRTTEDMKVLEKDGFYEL